MNIIFIQAFHGRSETKIQAKDVYGVYGTNAF